MRTRLIFATFLLLVSSAWATTLEQLSVDQMIQQSTAVVRAKVTGPTRPTATAAFTPFTGSQVTENLKSTTLLNVEVAVPGGVLGARQSAWCPEPDGRRLRPAPVDQPLGSDAGHWTFPRRIRYQNRRDGESRPCAGSGERPDAEFRGTRGCGPWRDA